MSIVVPDIVIWGILIWALLSSIESGLGIYKHYLQAKQRRMMDRMGKGLIDQAWRQRNEAVEEERDWRDAIRRPH